LSDGADLDRQNQAQSVFAPLLKLIETTGAGVLLLTQAGKSSGGRAAHSVALEGIARWLLRLTPSNTKKTLTALGNNAESKVFPISLSPYKIELTEKVEKIRESRTSSADGTLPERANFILDNAPLEVRGGVKILGKWFAEQNKGVNTPGSGRALVNNLIKGGLLVREGSRGQIVAGPKLVTSLSTRVVV